MFLELCAAELRASERNRVGGPGGESHKELTNGQDSPSETFASSAAREKVTAGNGREAMKWIFAAAEFLRRFRRQLRFGERSRLPLKLVRLEFGEDYAECEWVARGNDPWDMDVAPVIREQNQTCQALQDALSVREVLFASIPQLQAARLKVYRQQEAGEPELIISGTVSREDYPPRVSSLAMRAQLYGFQFFLEDGSLRPLGISKALQFATD